MSEGGSQWFSQVVAGFKTSMNVTQKILFISIKSVNLSRHTTTLLGVQTEKFREIGLPATPVYYKIQRGFGYGRFRLDFASFSIKTYGSDVFYP